jgi:SAM-dependent methyltransferase
MSDFNFLIHRINRDIARRLPYQGVVVDLGCGTSPYKSLILASAERYLGIDWPNSYHSQENVDICGDITRGVPVQSESANTVVSFQVLEHLPVPDIFLSECHRILRSGGVLYITVPFMWHVHEAPYDYYRYTRHGLQYMLEKHGFAGIIIEENTGFWQMWGLKLNYHSLRFARGPLRTLFRPFWWLIQEIAPLLDRIDPHPEETASYTVRARKP